MNESRVIALRFRPKTFDQVVGQEAIVQTLTNAIRSGTLHHAYLFAGARGVGKTTTARLVARALNCANGPTAEPCGVCPSCTDIADSRSMLVTEIDAASNTSVDNVRQVIVNSTTFSPPANQHRVFIVDEVHQLSGAAFNALLKTIEEPPPRVVFIMATTELQKVPDTIVSRCQVFEFRTIPLPKVVAELKRIARELGINISDSALNTIARSGEGSMRDAESAFDQVISFAGSDVSDEDVSIALGLPSFETLRGVLEAVADQDAQAILRIVETIVTRGYDIRNFCREVMTYVRNLLVVKVAGFDQELTQMPESEAGWIAALADRFSDQDLIRFFSILSKTEQDIKLSSQPRFQLEIGLVKMAQAARLYLLEDAIDRMAAIEARLSGQNRGADGRGSGSGDTRKPGPEGASRPTRPAPARSSKPSGPESTRTQTHTDVRRLAETAPPGPSSPSAPTTSEPHRPGPDAEPDSSRAASSVEPAIAASDSRLAADQPAVQRASRSTGAPEAPGVNPESQEAGSDQRGEPSAGIEKLGIDKLKKVLETRKKMMLSIALDHADTAVLEGQFLKLSYAPRNRHYKEQVEDSRRAIEEACYEALGTRVTLSASLGGSAPPGGPAESAADTGASKRGASATNIALPEPAGSAAADQPHTANRSGSSAISSESPGSARPARQVGGASAQESVKAGESSPENHPSVRAIIEKFQGEIIGVDVPDR